MKKNWWYRFLFMVGVLVLSIATLVPTVFDVKEDSSYPFKSKVNLGLDLQGGLYIVLGIDFNKVYKEELGLVMKRAQSYLESEEEIKATLGQIQLADVSDPKMEIVFSSAEQTEKGKEVLRDQFGQSLRVLGLKDTALTFGLNAPLKLDIEKNSVSKSIEVIRNRIDEFGVTEPEITSLGDDRIIVQLPGVKDIDRAKELIGKTAKLEFRLVNLDIDQNTLLGWVEEAKGQGIEYKKGERFSDYVAKINEFAKTRLPANSELVFQKDGLTRDQYVPSLVSRQAAVTGEDLQDARVTIDPQDQMPQVAFELKGRGTKAFSELTGNNVGKPLAIILDGTLYSAPTIQSRIPGGRGVINLGRGNRNDMMKEASDLALVLRAGALPVQLEFQEQRIVGPSLGRDSIEKARLAGLIGAVCVFLFILIYYKMAGGIAVFTLALNVSVVLAFLVGLDATLTLPGIAGIALTVGMAVDANIIIYERIKEELARGATARPAIESGFQKAFWTILDANLTTAVAGAALLNFGTGPIRGFAVTLLIGILATVYSSYFAGGLLFEYMIEKNKGQKVSI